MANIKLGSDILQNVTKIKVQNADSPDSFVDFAEGGGQRDGYLASMSRSTKRIYSGGARR